MSHEMKTEQFEEIFTRMTSKPTKSIEKIVFEAPKSRFLFKKSLVFVRYHSARQLHEQALKSTRTVLKKNLDEIFGYRARGESDFRV